MTRSYLSKTGHRSRAAFTVVELLVVVTVIGILAGIIVPAVMNAVGTAREATVAFEMKQMESAIESFKSKYGFYPPTMGVSVTSAGEMLAYVNRISPQHSERISSGVTGGGSLPGGVRTRLEHWWIEVGQHLDFESSLTFWLSGICTNKQFPVTGFVANAAAETDRWSIDVPPLGAHGFSTYVFDDGSTDGFQYSIERDVIYDFKPAQLVGDDAGETVLDGDGSGLVIPATVFVRDVKFSGTDTTALVGAVLEYRQGHGSRADYSVQDIRGGSDTDADGVADGPEIVAEAFADYRFKYLDAAGGYGTVGGTSLGYHNGTTFVNPNSFQLITFGMDGLPGMPGNTSFIDATGVFENPFGVTGPTNFNNYFGDWGRDNMCNFADGRLEKWVNSGK